MIVSHKHKLIFVRTRKTAGSSLSKLIYPYLGESDTFSGLKLHGINPKKLPHGVGAHASEFYISRRYSEVWDSYYKFTIERNPWQRAVSLWHWQNYNKPDEFSRYPFPKYCRLMGGGLSNWRMYANKNNKITVDDVFLYEDLSPMFDKLKDCFDIDIKDQWESTRLKSGITPNKHYSEYYDYSLRDYISEICQHEIETFGYFFSKKC